MQCCQIGPKMGCKAMWPKWVRAGERSEFRVHSPEPYRLSLWRYGWQKELVRPIGWLLRVGWNRAGPRDRIEPIALQAAVF